mgnify:CR=1 FL=1
MGIVNIDDELHDQLRKASTVSFRSINVYIYRKARSQHRLMFIERSKFVFFAFSVCRPCEVSGFIFLFFIPELNRIDFSFEYRRPE